MVWLGITTGHDAGVALIADGEILFAANEERYSRRKLHVGFPSGALAEALGSCRLTPGDVSGIAVEGATFKPLADFAFEGADVDWRRRVVGSLRLGRATLGTEVGLAAARRALGQQTRSWHRAIHNELRKLGFACAPVFVDHHTAHIASASHTQQAGRVLAVTLDGSGEGYCSRVGRVHGTDIALLHAVPSYWSPATLYALVTHVLGFTPLRHEGKITGLAAYGDPIDGRSRLATVFGYDAGRMSFRNTLGYGPEAARKLRRLLKGLSREDVAAGVQAIVEEAVFQYVRDAWTRWGAGSDRLVLAGGLFANVRLNAFLRSRLPVDILVVPNMGDGGLGLGVALAASGSRAILESAYLGSEIPADDAAVGAIADDVAALLAQAHTVGIARGRMEWGPRALGHRSILASATDASVNDNLNRMLQRTEFMPFAPIVRDVDARRYFAIPEACLHAVNTSNFAYMTETCPVTQAAVREIPAVCHVDGTARPQVVTAGRNPFIYEVLSRYHERTNIGAVVNTSFNMHEEPIVCTADDARRAFAASSLDALVVGDELIRRDSSGA